VIRLTDVVLRDGLQDEDVVVPTSDKARIAAALADAGVAELEVASFVSPRRIPQMADSAQLVSLLRDSLDVRLVGIALNGRGLVRALATPLDELRVVISASDGHSMANAGAPARELLMDMASHLTKNNPPFSISAALSVAFNCPYDGPVQPSRVVNLVGDLVDLGVRRVSLADTLGTAAPAQVAETLDHVVLAFPDISLGLHLHDAGGQALETVTRALDHGVDQFDSSLGGIGGCPFAPGAHGNLDTAKLVRHLHSLGHQTAINVAALASAEDVLRDVLATCDRAWVAKPA
jgi:hydroxymethylglutaryl-CoA lyase